MKRVIAPFIIFLMIGGAGCTQTEEPRSTSMNTQQSQPGKKENQTEELVQQEIESEPTKIEGPEQKKRSIQPAHLEIPSIKVSTDVMEVGLTEDGNMAVPDSYEEVGWFSLGYNPGEKGNAVLAGHVDHKTGPAVFFELKSLKTGDEIHLSDESGQELTFVVESAKRYPYNEAPLQTVFGASDERRLNLVTCIGHYDPETNNHDERLVVYTVLKGSDS